MTITPLGSGQEVGRSCHLLQFRNTTILLDCGIHPGYEGMGGLPFFDQVEPETVDVLLVTHFHLDHAGSLPYFTERTKFKGDIYMTHPTKAVTRLLLGDYRRLSTLKKAATGDSTADGAAEDPNDVLYTEAELQSCVDKIKLIDYHQTISLSNGLKFHALNAGHVLGAAMFFIEFGGGRSVLYTGDYSMEEDRHLMAAELPNVKPDVLIVESTYGVQVHASRHERETRFTSTIERVVMRGGNCLIPVFALGRAQELLLILDEHWKNNPRLHGIPVWYASKMADRALRVCQTYANMMNAHIRAQMDVGNPFKFTHIRNLKSIDVHNFNDRGPCVVFASPGMLQSGVSRQLFDRWASEPKNGCLIAGYAVEHTLAKDIMNQPKEVVTMEGRRQPLNCLVDYVSFSAHVDFVQNRNFITSVDPIHIILVHGQKDEMGRLKAALIQQYKKLPKNKRPSISMPTNIQPITLKFQRRRAAKVMGSLADRRRPADALHTIDDDNDEDDDTKVANIAENLPIEGESVQGILVTQNFQSKIVSPEDMRTYTPLRVGSLSSKLHVPFSGGGGGNGMEGEDSGNSSTGVGVGAGTAVGTLRLFLNEMFCGVSEVWKDDLVEGGNAVVVFGLHNDEVTLTTGRTKGIATVEWKASTVGDILADSVVALLMHAQSSAASIRLSGKPCFHRQPSNDDDTDSTDGPEPANKRVRGENDGNDDVETSTTTPKQTRTERILRLFHTTLLQQFATVEAVYEGALRVSFEIQTDAGLESGSLGEGNMLLCNVMIEFENGTLSTDAKITVECEDEKLGENVRDCLKNVALTAAPLKL